MRSTRPNRLIDVVATIAPLTGATIPMTGIGVVIRVTIGPPVLFRHRRPGLHCELFGLLKVRRMRDHRDADGKLLPNEHEPGRPAAVVDRVPRPLHSGTPLAAVGGRRGISPEGRVGAKPFRGTAVEDRQADRGAAKS